MVEYKVEVSLTGGSKDAEDRCNYNAKEGWRLVSTAAASHSGSLTLLMFFEREKSAAA